MSNSGTPFIKSGLVRLSVMGAVIHQTLMHCNAKLSFLKEGKPKTISVDFAFSPPVAASN
jgi:hypothetical protein